MKKSILLITVCLSACGTVFNGGSQDIRFDSNVKGTQIIIDGLKVCRTPCVFTMERQASPVTVVAKKEGYEEQVSVIKSEFSKKSLFNLTFWPSWLTDAVSGGMWQYNRTGVYIDMQPLPNQTQAPAYQQRYYQRYSENSKNDTAIRKFSLFNYNELREEAFQRKSGEYIKTLAKLSGKPENELINVINSAQDEVTLAHNLTGIK